MLIRFFLFLLLSWPYLLWAKTISFELIHASEHPSNHFTQGLIIDNNVLYESSGLYGKSFIYQYDLDTQQKKYVRLPKELFAEGITIIGDTLYVLTWKAGVMILLDKKSLSYKGSMHYQGEGWGLTTDGENLIMSDGSEQLTIRDPKGLGIKKTLTVKGVNYLNELEYHNGIIWANRWYDDLIYLISADDGCVLGTIDVSKLKQAATADKNNVTNGIAYHKETQGFLITGKFWSQQFLIKPHELPHNCAPDS